MASLMKESDKLVKTCESAQLTEKVVLIRTRAKDLESVRKLNCWASNIGDVAVVRNMPNLEVCSLSINNISTLKDFAHCPKLQELYVRTNCIDHLEDIHYLKHLKKLRSLWLAENPCAERDNYRLSVLRTLPNLQKLDNLAVTKDELSQAKEQGDEIPEPEDFSMSGSTLDMVTSSKDSISEDTGTNESTDNWASPRTQRRRHRKREKNSETMSSEEGSNGSMKNGEGGEESSGQSVEESINSPRSDHSLRDTELNGVNEAGEGKIILHQRKVEGNLNVSLDENRKQDSYMKDEDVKAKTDDDVDEESSDLTTPRPTSDLTDTMKLLMKAGVNNQENNTNNNKGETNVRKGISLTDEDKTKDLRKSPVTADVVAQKLNSFNDHRNELYKGNEKLEQESLLDKIKLEDSLNVSESHCSVSVENIQSMDLEDFEVPVTDSGKSFNSHNSQEKTGEMLSQSKDTDLESIAPDESCEKKLDASTDASVSISLPGGEQSEVSTLRKSVCVASKDGRAEVDWDEYNRLRREAGVSPVVKAPVSARSVNSDLIRNSNILNAALSLVKDLDRDSLEILQTSVKARLDSLQ